jgi:hypothetical protein
MVDLAPTAGAGVSAKILQISAVGFDGVHGRIALAQRAEEISDGFFDNGFARPDGHSHTTVPELTTESQRHGEHLLFLYLHPLREW